MRAAGSPLPGVILVFFWTHNDSGGGAWLYAFDRSGQSLGRWAVPGARANDWEDIAAGPGPKRGESYLYIGDIGDNNSRRPYVTVYRIPEPASLNQNRNERSRPKPSGSSTPTALTMPKRCWYTPNPEMCI